MAQSIADAPETATNHKRLGNIQALLGGVHLRRIRKPALITLGLLLGFVAVFFVYLSVSHIIGSNSDNASIILEGQAMLHGNLLLHGWYLPPDSFITTEMALDALGSVFFSGEQLLKITPAFLFTATVFGAAYLASRNAAGPARRRWLAVGACVAIIAFPVGPQFYFAMQGPMHFGTIVASLLAWLAYDHFTRHQQSWGAWGLFVLVTTLAIIGDPMAELLIVPPVGVVCALVLWQTRFRDRAARVMLGGAALALALGIGARQLLIIGGTHIQTATATPALVSVSHLWPHLQWMLLSIAQFFHIDLRLVLGFNQWLLFLLLNGAFLLVGVVGFARLFRHTLIPKDLRDSLSSVLAWAIIGTIMAFLFTDFATNFLTIRYLLPAGVYAGILCYDAFARVVAERYLMRFVLAFLVVSSLTFGIMLANAQRAAVPQQQLIAFLESHHLSTGFGSYWAANITTLLSDGQVHVLPVMDTPVSGHIHVYRWHASADWFQGAQFNSARFVVVDGSVKLAPFQTAVNTTFGPPDQIYHLSGSPGYTIFVWNHPIPTAAIGLT